MSFARLNCPDNQVLEFQLTEALLYCASLEADVRCFC